VTVRERFPLHHRLPQELPRIRSRRLRDLLGRPDCHNRTAALAAFRPQVANGDGKIIAFLKRDFRSVELSELDEGGEESTEEEPEAQEPLTRLSPTKLESALADLVPTVHPPRWTPAPGAESSNMRNFR
jgi:hypothetical protein